MAAIDRDIARDIGAREGPGRAAASLLPGGAARAVPAGQRREATGARRDVQPRGLKRVRRAPGRARRGADAMESQRP